MHITLSPMVNEEVFVEFRFQSLIIIMVDVYVCVLALRLLFDYENVFVCDVSEHIIAEL